MGCPSLLRRSSLHHNLRVIYRLAALSLSSAAVVSPSSRWCWIVAAPLLLAGSSGVQRRSSWTSAVISPQAPSLELDLLVSCVTPAVCTGPPDTTLFVWTMLFPPCRLTGAVGAQAVLDLQGPYFRIITFLSQTIAFFTAWTYPKTHQTWNMHHTCQNISECIAALNFHHYVSLESRKVRFGW